MEQPEQKEQKSQNNSKSRKISVKKELNLYKQRPLSTGLEKYVRLNSTFQEKQEKEPFSSIVKRCNLFIDNGRSNFYNRYNSNLIKSSLEKLRNNAPIAPKKKEKEQEFKPTLKDFLRFVFGMIYLFLKA